jgi:hypothetical protein
MVSKRHSSCRAGRCNDDADQLQEVLPLVPLQLVFPLQLVLVPSCFVPLQLVLLSVAQPERVNVEPAIRLATLNPARIFLSCFLSMCFLLSLSVGTNQFLLPRTRKTRIITRKTAPTPTLSRVFSCLPSVKEEVNRVFPVFLVTQDCISVLCMETMDHRIVLPDGREPIVHERAGITFDNESFA